MPCTQLVTKKGELSPSLSQVDGGIAVLTWGTLLANEVKASVLAHKHESVFKRI